MSTTEDDLETVTISTDHPGGEFAYPRAIVKINDRPVDAWLEWSVTNNTFFSADEFRVSFSVSDLPSDKDIKWFATQKKIFVEILAGFPSNHEQPDPSELQSLIYGRVDGIEFDPAERLLTLTGRDLTGVLIDTPCRREWVNHRSSDIVNEIAFSHELSPVVTRTDAFTGEWDSQNHWVLRASGSEWDLVSSLAQREGFVCYVTDERLYFGPDLSASADPYDITWIPPTETSSAPQSNAMAVSFEKSMTIAAGATVTVRSADIRTGIPRQSFYPRAATPDAQPYLFTVAANTPQDQLEKIARERYANIVQQEMKLRVRLPGDNAMSVSRPIRVTGTGTPFDQVYFPVLIERGMSMDGGYEMTVDAQNHSPNLAVAEQQPVFVRAGGG